MTIALSHSKDINIISLDKNKFKQILYNLISNAIKFNHAEGTISITTELHGTDSFIMKVKDSGIGIAKDGMNKLFIPFVQLDSGTTRKNEGTGLGLALTKTITELHGGTISAESIVGQGSTFSVLMPINYKN